MIQHHIISFLLAISLCNITYAENKKTETKSEIPLQELRIFAEVFGRIKQDYAEPVNDKELLNYAIKGMLSGLDPHSTYLDTAEYEELKEGTSGEFGGLGIEVSTEDGFVKVISPIDDTPASRAGIKSGDFIIKIDGKPIKGMNLNDAVKLMRGKPGEKITLTIVREDEKERLEFTLTRAIIKSISVKSKYYEGGFGYVRVSSFQTHTTEDLIKAIKKLKKKNKGSLNGFILDLRNNPGGLLTSAVEISDAFITKGLIVYTQGRKKNSRIEFNAKANDILAGAPIVVLVNGGSASASEIVSGALQDHKRAIIMGRPTFGKGSVQTILPITGNIAIKLTTARYYTPKGRSIQAEGIQPDVLLESVDVSLKKKSFTQLKEKDLSGHLSNSAKKSKKKNKDSKGKQLLIETDYELNEALNLLKGLTVLKMDSNN